MRITRLNLGLATALFSLLPLVSASEMANKSGSELREIEIARFSEDIRAIKAGYEDNFMRPIARFVDSRVKGWAEWYCRSGHFNPSVRPKLVARIAFMEPYGAWWLMGKRKETASAYFEGNGESFEVDVQPSYRMMLVGFEPTSTPTFKVLSDLLREHKENVLRQAGNAVKIGELNVFLLEGSVDEFGNETMVERYYNKYFFPLYARVELDAVSGRSEFVVFTKGKALEEVL